MSAPPQKPGRPRKSVASPAASAVGVLDDPIEGVITEVSHCVPDEIPIEALEGCPQMPRRQFPLALRLEVLQFIEAKLKEGLILEHIINPVSRKVGIPLRIVNKWWFSGGNASSDSLTQRGLTFLVSGPGQSRICPST